MKNESLRSQASRPRMRARLAPASAVIAGVIALSGCASGSPNGTSTSSSPHSLTTVTFAMDYFPGAEDAGLAYALQKGLFAKQGIELKVLPFSSTAAETLVSAGTADVGIGTNFGTISLAVAAGAKMKSIFTIETRNPAFLSVLKSSGITRPSQLGGKLYGGYGQPSEKVLVNTMIKADGGTQASKQVTLGSGLDDALRTGKVDVVATYPEDQYVFAQEHVAIRSFDPAKYGVPQLGGTSIIASTSWLSANPKVARGLVAALQQGYQEAIKNPKAVDAALVKEYPDLKIGPITFEEAIYAKLFANPYGPVGTASPSKWVASVNWMAKNGLFVDAAGNTITSFNPKPIVTNAYLPKSN